MSKIKLEEVEKSVLIMDYKKLAFVPNLDKLLDWRTQLVRLKSKPEYISMKNLYNLEIKAVDYLMQKYYS